ncbi:DUF2169 domain-containing protein [Tabrizicola sp.]|uniref:DUF2169 family type VI secretion system accessory protein n=1 Tax=Tabrizicola sp. TaxID=2005166 RepID=UPI002735A8FC|nr:DUF2169 domain-containing protein [Tabrizicola sp.]MDP3195609.1 DUF2169 domain-containing protein [Tabrizicola sp.]
MRLENTTPFPANFTLALDKQGHEQIVLVVRATFTLSPARGAPTLIAPVQLPLIEADVFGPDPAWDATIFETDFAHFRPRCDVLAQARAHAPGGEPATSVDVGIRLGGWAKKFTAHGSRIWLRGAAGHAPSEKRPFLVQDIGYDHAYGGIDPEADNPATAKTYPENPVGLGYYPNSVNREGKPLAQTSEFGADAVSPDGGFPPMAFGPLGRTWMPRRQYAGTYDEFWLDNRVPLLPLDFDDRYFQASAPDQQISYPLGGEAIEIVNLSPEGRLSGQVPLTQIVVTFERKSGRITQRIANLDTVLFLPEDHRMCLTWRTRITAERDLFEFARAIIVERPLEGATHWPGGVKGGPNG